MRETPAEPVRPDAAASAAFTALLNRHQWPLYAFLRGFVSQDEQARDLTQDVFADAWRATLRAAPPFAALAHAHDVSAGSAGSAGSGADDDAMRRWLFHTAYCRAISVLRRRRLIRWESLDARDTADTTDPRLGSVVARGAQPGGGSVWAEPFTEPFEERVVEEQALAAALAALAPADVACLLLSVVQGFTTAEIAQVIEATPDAAKKRLSRAKQRLRAVYLAQNGPPSHADQASHPSGGPHTDLASHAPVAWHAKDHAFTSPVLGRRDPASRARKEWRA